MRYYVVSDPHAFCTLLKTTLESVGFFRDKTPHKLIICGDLMDRGPETIEMQNFVLDLMKKDEVILIKGNHEDLLVDFIEKDKWAWLPHHVRNGTIETALDLAGCGEDAPICNTEEFLKKVSESPFFKYIIPKMLDYYETEKYIFVHGYIPCYCSDGKEYSYFSDWRNAPSKMWEQARWLNGMLVNRSVKEYGKTVVCGHFHTSYGHSIFNEDGAEFGLDANFSPYYADGIIAIDGCTAYSGIINCVIIEDEPIPDVVEENTVVVKDDYVLR